MAALITSFLPRRRSWRRGSPHRPARPGPSARLRLRLVLARHRRAVVAGLLAIAVATGLQSLRPGGPPTATVLVAACDLPAGHRLTTGDLVIREWPGHVVPAGVLGRPQGRVLAAPVRRGEPVTDVRVTHGRAAPAGRLPAGWVTTAVRLSDPASTLLVAPGDRVEVIAGGVGAELGAPAPGLGGRGRSGAPRVLVADAVVLATPAATTARATDPSGDSSGGLLGAFSDSSSRASAAGASADSPGEGQLPAGVLELGVPSDGAVELAAAAGVGYVTIARHVPASG
jgi:pilus assembly protein CpaB